VTKHICVSAISSDHDAQANFDPSQRGRELYCLKINAVTEESGTMGPQPSAKPCPICRVSMVGSRTGLIEFDHFECLNCGLVMDYSRSENTPLWTAKSTNKIREQ